MIRLEQVRALSGVEQRFLFKAILWLPITAVLLRLAGYRRTLSFYQRHTEQAAQSPVAPQDIDTAKIAARMINVAANHGLYRAVCLQKSLLLVKFLRAREIPCTLILGARRQAEEFGAHAWVECNGVVVNDDESVDLRYAAFKPPADGAV